MNKHIHQRKMKMEKQMHGEVLGVFSHQESLDGNNGREVLLHFFLSLYLSSLSFSLFLHPLSLNLCHPLLLLGMKKISSFIYPVW